MTALSRFLLFGILLVLLGFFVPSLYATNMSMSATIPAQESDYQLILHRDTPEHVFSQEQTITYTITYGTTLPNENEFTLEAQWYPGILQISPAFPTADVMAYVNGSATDGYNNIPAVIDPVNRKISWHFTAFPANTTSQTVTFQLKTVANYTGNYPVFMLVKTRILGPGVTTRDLADGTTYLYSYTAQPTAPTATPTTANTTTTDSSSSSSSGGNSSPYSTSNTTPTTTPTPPPVKLPKITAVEMQTISSTQASISFQTDVNTTATMSYGISPSALSTHIISLTSTTDQLITLPNLTRNTQYYFQILVKDAAGNAATSDLFTFKTASSDQTSVVQIPSIFITADNKLMTIDNTETTKLSAPTILLPQETVYEIQFAFDKKQPIKSVQLIVRNKHILGETNVLSAQKTPKHKISNDMIEVRPGIFTTKLITPDKAGIYELFAHSADYNGNINEQKVGEVIVSPPLQVKDASNHPIENARVFLYIRKNKTNSYIVSSNYPTSNPTYTDVRGQDFLVLPPGTYKAHITALGYGEKDAIFTIGGKAADGYPTIILKAEPFSVMNYLYYLQNATTDVWNASFTFLQNLAVSSRIFNLTAVVLLWIFVIITFLTFSIKTRTHPHVSVTQLGYILHRLFTKNPEMHYLKGIVVDKKSGLPLAHVQVFVLDNDSKSVLYESYSNGKGSFLLKKPEGSFHIIVVKKGFEPMVIYPRDEELMHVALHPQTHNTKLHNKLSHTLSRILSMLFETLIVASLVMEFFLSQVFGLEKTWPFITLSLLNVVLWFYFLSIKHHKDI